MPNYGIQRAIASSVGISESHLTLILNGDRRPSWERAKALSKYCGKSASWWMEASSEQMRAVVAELSVEQVRAI